jgi:hypothetical protein
VAKWWREIADRERGNREMGDEEEQLALAALGGLWQGNLQPLALFLRAGYPLNYMLRRELVHAITGEDNQFYRLELHKRGRRGETNVISKLHTRVRNNAIGKYVEERLPEDGKAEAAFAAAMEEFQVERGVVVAAWSAWRKRPRWGFRL